MYDFTVLIFTTVCAAINRGKAISWNDKDRWNNKYTMTVPTNLTHIHIKFYTVQLLKQHLKILLE